MSVSGSRLGFVDKRIPIVQVGYQRYQTFQAVIEISGRG